MREYVKEILEEGLIAIIRGVNPAEVVDTVDALCRGGIRCVEITFDQTNISDTVESIRLVCDVMGDKMLVGAGTVLTREQVELAESSGAKYMISPNVDTKVIKRTKELGCVSLPGALTPTEIITAFGAGADIIKLFPAGSMGVSYLKDMMGPLGYIPYYAVGSISVDNMKAFYDIGIKGFGIGGNLVNLKAIQQHDFAFVEAAARRYTDYWNHLKNA